MTTEHRIIGRSTRKIDARAKATGRAKYTADLTLPNMLHAKRSAFYVDSQPRAAVLHALSSVWEAGAVWGSCTLNATFGGSRHQHSMASRGNRRLPTFRPTPALPLHSSLHGNAQSGTLIGQYRGPQRQ